MSEIVQIFRESLQASIALKKHILETQSGLVVAAGDLLVAAYKNGRKAIFMGNGGSAADAQHLAAEMEGRFAFERQPLPALALHANASTLTAIGNDYGYDQVFSRLLTAHAKPGDVVIALSTSGTSKNVLAAAALKERLGVKLIAFTGQNASALAPYADVVLAVPSTETPRIQECHITLGHILCQFVERSLFRPDGP